VQPTSAQQPAGAAPVEPEATAEPELVEPTEPAEATIGTGATIGEEDIDFRLSSDWGAAFPGQEVQFTFTLRNEGNPLEDISITSNLPANLTVDGATSDRGGDPLIDNNEVRFTLDSLDTGEAVDVTITTRINSGVPAGTILVVQGQLLYSNINVPINSNVVTVRIVGDTVAAVTMAPTTGNTPTPTATGPTATPDATASATSGTAIAIAPTNGAAAVAATEAPTVAGVAVEPGAPADAEAPIPATSAGVPFAGIFLLGLTLMVRTIRLHRARERI
jgi:uncharacterized repeat protein (TIGR01451 family)